VVRGDRKNYSRLRIAGCPVTDETGLPELPYIKEFVAVPECKDIRVAFIAEDMRIDDIDVYPVPRIVHEPSPSRCGMFPVEQFQQDAKAYRENSFYPKDRVAVAKVFKIRGQNVAELHIYPLHYSAGKRTLQFAKSMDITLSYGEPASSVCVRTGPFESLCRSLMLNYDFGSSATPQRGIRPAASGIPGRVDTCSSLSQCPGADYLMIVGHQLWTTAVGKSAALSLAQKRANFNGFTVAVIDIANIVGYPVAVDDDEALKASLIQFYGISQADHMGDGKLGYIMLVGDAYICPADNDSCPDDQRETIVPAHHEPYSFTSSSCYPTTLTSATDNWYASLDSMNDFSPDVFIGRASADDPEEAQRFLLKLAGYEPQNTANNWHNWHRKALLIKGAYSGGLEDLADQCASLTPPGYVFNAIGHTWPGGTSWEQYSQEIQDSIDAGYMLLVEFGHGMEYYWMDSFLPKYYDALSNQNHYPVIFAFSCLTAKFDLPCHILRGVCDPCGHPNHRNCGNPLLQTICDPAEGLQVDSFDCMGERMTVTGNSGAIAYLGFSGNAGSEDLFVVSRFYDRFFTSGCIGEAALETFYYLSDGNKKMLTLLSDPALNVLFEDYTPPSDSIDIAVNWHDVDFDPPIFNACGTSNFIARVRNSGVHDAYDVPVVLYMDSTEVGNVTLNSLEAYHDTTLHFSVSPSEGSHSLSLRVNPDSTIVEMNYSNNAVDTVVAAFCLQAGFPVDVDSTALFAPPTVLYADDDGYKEILVNEDGTGIRLVDQTGALVASKGNLTMAAGYVLPAGYVHSGLQRGVLCVQNGYLGSDQRELTLLDASTLSQIASTSFTADDTTRFHAGGSALYDVNRDGYSDVLYYERYYGYAIPLSDADFTGMLRIFCYDPDSASFDAATSLALDYRPLDVAIEDLDYDNHPEIALLGFKAWIGGAPDAVQLIIDVYTLDSLMSLSLEKHVTFNYSAGSGLDATPYTVADRFKGNIQICDVDYSPTGTSNYLDVVATLNNKLLVLRTTSSSLEEYSVEIPYDNPYSTPPIIARASLACADLDADGHVEMIVSGDHRLNVYRYASGAISLIDSTTVTPNDRIIAGPLVSDVDGDNGLELLLATADTTETWPHLVHFNLHLMNDDLDEERGWSAANIYGTGSATLAIDEIDGDGKQEIVLRTPSRLYLLEMPVASGNAPVWAMEDGTIARTNCVTRYMKGSYDENVSLFGPVLLLGDVSIGYMTTLFVRPGAAVEVKVADETQGGSDADLVELNVSGRLEAVGTAAEHIPFVSTEGGNLPDGWLGIDMLGSGAVGYLKYCDVANAIKGYHCAGASTPDTLMCSSFSYCFTAGIYITGTGGSNAAYVLKCSANGNAGSGVVIDHCDDAVIDSCTCNDNNANGVSLLYSCSTVEHSTMSGNHYGIRSDATSGDAPLISRCAANENSQAGMYFKNTAGTIEYCSMNENTLYGLLCEGTYATVEVKSSSIIGNNIGVKTLSSSYPVLGNVSSSKGMLNSIHSSTNQNVYHGSAGTLKAERCWWGADPPPRKFYGNVDYTPYLSEDPIPQQQSSPNPKVAELTYSLADNYPNPFNPATTIEYSIAEESPVNLSIYNVNGQLVRTLVSEFQARNTYTVRWDGKNQNGVSVASGVYFYRLQAASFVKTKKLVLLR